KELKDEGLDKNTIVIFTSDNGPAPSFNQNRTNGLRGQKASLFEGGICMPFIIWGPKASVPKGKVDDFSVISALDMFSTICSITNNPLPANFDTDGEDMSDALFGNPQKRAKNIYWEYRRNDNQAFPKPQGLNLSPNIAIRSGDWKLLVNKDGSEVMLFNLKDDIKETNNLAQHYPEIVKMLKNLTLKWRNSLPEYRLNEQNDNTKIENL
ncbi:MAG: sulfatase-like hydrolase/transferase, partial [Dysgonamonadaceae bacterium]